MGQLASGGRLPPVLPIVLYNGNRRWDAPVEVADLIVPAPKGLDAYSPRLKYLLLDEGSFADSELEPLRNLVAVLFRLENSLVIDDVKRVLPVLVSWLESPEQTSLRRAFTVWLKRVFLPGRMPGVEFGSINDLQEVQSMLAERVTEWTEQWERQGIVKGEAIFLLRMLESRFGPLDDVYRNRILEADSETLLQWGERVLSAPSAAQLFDR